VGIKFSKIESAVYELFESNLPKWWTGVSAHIDLDRV